MAKWFVCKNQNGVHYHVKKNYPTIQEFWDSEVFLVAIYGPCSKQNALEIVNDMNTEDLDYSRTSNTIILNSFDDDFDDDDYAGLVSNPKG